MEFILFTCVKAIEEIEIAESSTKSILEILFKDRDTSSVSLYFRWLWSQLDLRLFCSLRSSCLVSDCFLA